MAYYATISELIKSVKDQEISYRNIHDNIFLRNKGEIIGIPYSSVIRNYMPFFESCVVMDNFSDSEKVIYRFKPKKLSYDLYGTTELWSVLLELNHMISILDFNLEKRIKVYEPKSFLKLLNEVLILEGVIS